MPRFVPAPVWNAVKSLAGYRLFYTQRHTLSSGVTVRVSNHPEWVVFNEIFVEGEYDDALRDMLADPPAGRPFSVLDLGANAGFFVLRTFDLLQRLAPGRAAHVVAVEGAASTHRTLVRMLTEANTLGGVTTAVHGLVGKRTGAAAFAEYPSTTRNNLFEDNLVKKTVPFVDVAALVPGEVDLIKCDIEGAEELFLEHYPDLLARTRRIAIELHHDWADVARCRTLLREAGLAHVRTAVETATMATEHWARPSL